MMKQISSYVDNCVQGQKNQPTLKVPSIPPQPLPVITKVWFRVGMDLTGPLIHSEGYTYILTMIDHFTKWIETRPLRSKDAEEVARGLFSILCKQGAPVQIISDNGTEFTNKISKALHDAYDCKLIFSAPYHPQTKISSFLLPVVQQLLFTSYTLPKSDCIMLPTPASTDLEDLCVIWGGQFEGIELVNTCPVDNFITLQSLHSYQISEALRLSDVSPTTSFQTTMLSHIEHREFDELRIWLALNWEFKM